jgi:N-hydroxyarylamine O-acetyltransferase
MFDAAGYLRRLHLGDPGAPSVSVLQTLHKAHVEWVAYEALDIQLHRPTSIDPYESAERKTTRLWVVLTRTLIRGSP